MKNYTVRTILVNTTNDSEGKPTGGIRIITGLDKPSIDGVATSEVVNVKILETDEYKKAEGIRNNILNYSNQWKKEAIALSAKQQQSPNDEIAHKVIFDRKKARESDILAEEEKLKPELPKVKAKRISLIKEQAIYHEVGLDDFLIDGDLHKIIFDSLEALPEFRVLEFNPESESVTEISNLKGVDYWTKTSGKWTKSTIQLFGDDVPNNSKTQETLTETEKQEITDQNESERLAKLTTAQKQAEIDNLKTSALSQSVSMRSGFEIQGDTKTIALNKSTEWYNAEIIKIDSRYK